MPLLSYLLTARVDVVVCFSLLYNGWQFTTTAVLVLNVSFIHPLFFRAAGIAQNALASHRRPTLVVFLFFFGFVHGWQCYI